MKLRISFDTSESFLNDDLKKLIAREEIGVK